MSFLDRCHAIFDGVVSLLWTLEINKALIVFCRLSRAPKEATRGAAVF